MTQPAKTAAELKGKTGLRRLINATGYSLQGLRAAWTGEDAFRTEFALALVLLPAAFLLPCALPAVTFAESLLLAATVMLVPIVEILNSAIEAAVDRCGMEIHPLAGRAKDMGSAAVFLALWTAGLAWLAVIVHAALA